MLAEWKILPDAGQRLVYRHGSLTPVGGVTDVSGFAQLARMFSDGDAGRTVAALVLPLVLLIDGQSRAHKLYSEIPAKAVLVADLAAMNSPDRPGGSSRMAKNGRIWSLF